MTQLLTILALVLTVTTAFAQTSKSVTYSESTRKTGPQDLLVKVQGVTTTVGITNEAVTANTVAVFGASKELKSAALVNLTFDGTTLTASGGGSSDESFTTFTGTNWDLTLGQDGSGTLTGDTDINILGTVASTNRVITSVRLITDGTHSLTLNGPNISGLTPGVVPLGVQWLRITSYGSTNYVTLDWLLSSTNGYLKQTPLGLDVDDTDLKNRLIQAESDIDALEASEPDLRNGPWQVYGTYRSVERGWFCTTANALVGQGDLITPIGTPSAISGDSTQWPSVRWASTGATNNSTCGANGALVYRFSDSIEAHFTVRLVETGMVRVVVGISSTTTSANLTASTNATGSYFTVFCDTSTSPTWWFSCKDGTTLNAVDTTVPVTTDQIDISFRLTPGDSVELLVNGNEVVPALTDNIPTTTTYARAWVVSRTLEDVSKNIQVARMKAHIYP